MVKLIIDSPAYAPRDFVEENNIHVVKLSYTLDGIMDQEGYESEWGDFFERLKDTKDFPKTSLPSPSEFLNAYESANEEDDIVVITISKSLSGTYNSACVARDMYAHPEKVFVVDSGQCCQSEFILIEEVVDFIKQGKTGAEIFDECQKLLPKICIQFVPSTMEYLKRGGRIGLLSATIANILNIKPILAFRNGVLTCTKKCLGMGKALSEIVSSVPKNFKKIYVCYIHESEFVTTLIHKVNDALHANIVEGKKIGPVIGSHIGIGAVGVASLEA